MHLLLLVAQLIHAHVYEFSVGRIQSTKIDG